MEKQNLILNFHDLAAVKLAGLSVPQPGKLLCTVGAAPAVGDVFCHWGVNYPSGERAAFRVVSRMHLWERDGTQSIQLNLELVVLHQP
jgi:hypothetical protein